MTIRWQAASQGVYKWSSKFRAAIALNIDFYIDEYQKFCQSFGYEIESPSQVVSLQKMLGEAAPATQKIVNNLPRWMSGRTNPNTNLFLFANSFGQNLEYIKRQVDKEQNNQFITTADLRETSQLYKVIDEKINKFNSSNINYVNNLTKNILKNTFFSCKIPSRYNKAKYWTGQYSLSNDSLFGKNSAYLTNPGTVQQIIDVSIPANYKLAFSFFYKTDAIENIKEENKFSCLIQLVYEDGTVKLFREGIDSFTNNSWKRFNYFVLTEKTVTNIEFQIALKNSSYVSELFVDCVQLEIGDISSNWHPDIYTKPSFLDQNLFPIVIAGNKNKKQEVHIFNDRYNFLYNVPPTRAKEITSLPDGRVIQNIIWSNFIEYTADDWPSQWTISNNKLARENLLVPGEIPFVYDLIEEDTILDNFYSLYTDFDITLLAITVYENIIYLLTKEVFNGETKYFIKFVNPIVSKYTKEYLEVFSDIEVNLSSYLQNTSLEGQSNQENYQIGLFEDSNKHLLIKLPNGQIIIYQLYYDYAYIDNNISAIYCKENYSSEMKTLTIFG